MLIADGESLREANAALRRQNQELEQEVRSLRSIVGPVFHADARTDIVGALTELGETITARHKPEIDRLNTIFAEAGGASLPERLESMEYVRDSTRWFQNRLGTDLTSSAGDTGRLRITLSASNSLPYFQFQSKRSGAKQRYRGLGCAAWGFPNGLSQVLVEPAPEPPPLIG